jgi:hypothetical protein
MLTIVPFTSDWSPAVRDFNHRLLAGGLDDTLAFPELPEPEFRATAPASLSQEFFLAVDDGVVRGAYFLTIEPWSLYGRAITVGNYRLPLSEGLINPEYRGVALAIMRHALKRQPFIYCLGMGSYDRPLPRTLAAMKWPMFTTPFFFHSVRPARVLRNLRSVRRTAARRMAFDIAAFTGAATLGMGAMQMMRSRRVSRANATVSVTGEFGSWADNVWARVSKQYTLIAKRDASVLNTRYPTDDARFVRLTIERSGSVIGWAILLDTQMSGHKQFGDLRVGTIVDVFGEPADAPLIVQSAAAALQERGVDLIASNQSHATWCDAFRSSGFLEGPSNRIFAASPKLAESLQPVEQNKAAMHLTRGDAAGPIHL